MYNGFEKVDVLLVEDNPNDAELTLRALKKKHFGNKVFVLEDGAEAIDFLFCKGNYSHRNKKESLKLILLDLKLPKFNGLEVLKQIKEDPILKRIPVVIVTSSKEDPDISKAYELGANSYVVKPIDFDQFTNVMCDLGFYWLLVNQVLENK